jgi:hypothetical protein
MTYINEVGDVLFTLEELDAARGESYARGWSDGADNTKIGFVRRLHGLERALANLEMSVPWGKKAHLVAARAYEELFGRFEEIQEEEDE